MPETPSSAIVAIRRFPPPVALLPPLVTAALQWLFAPLIEPHIWFLFYPALFVSSWVGNRRWGLVTTALTTGLVWWTFVPPKYVVLKDPIELFGAIALFATGILFVLFHDHLRKIGAGLQAAVRESRVYAAFLANSSDFIGIADPDGTPVYVNPAGRSMVGLPPDFPVGTTRIPEYYPPEQRAFVSDVIIKSMIERGEWAGDTFFRHWQTDAAIPVSDKHFMIREPDTGRILGMGTVTRDMSDIRRARDEIERSNERLARANAEITDLYEKVTKLDELKTRFFANVSHELRTPLTLVLGPIEKHLRATPGMDPELRRDLEVVERNARTVLRHVSDLLDVARLDAGRLRPAYARTDLAALVRLVSDYFSTLAREKQIAFVVEAPAALAADTDSDKLQRILVNLLSNAFKFTPTGGRVRVSLRDAGARVVFEVADSGPGIPAPKRGAVFERFEQLQEDAARPRGGTGLGLAIVKDFAALLGGAVSIDDAPEGGALFVVDLPAAAPAGAIVRQSGVAAEPANVREIELAVDDMRPRPAAAAVAEQAATGRDGTVLVVEDNRDMNRFLVEELRSEGFAVSAAFDGREGYEKALAERPDLVLTDITMPVMSGDEMVRLLRQRCEVDSTRLVVLTAKADDDLRVRLLHEGVQDYLTKPFSAAELRARVRNLVAQKRAEDRVGHLRRRLEAASLASRRISEAVASIPKESVRTVLQTIASNARTLIGAEYAAAGIGGDATRPFEIWAASGFSSEQAAAIERSPRPAGLLGLVSTENRTVRLADVRGHPAHRGFPPHHPTIRSFLGAPIRYRGRAVGNLFLANKRDGTEFTADDQHLVEMLAAHAGGAVETARLYAAESSARAWLQTVLDQMPEGILLMGADGHVTMQNRSLRPLTNATAPAADRFGNQMTLDLRRPSGERLLPDDFPIVKAIAERAPTIGCELIGRRADDRLVPLLVSAAPILTSEGELAGAAMVLQDISALKQLEDLREEWASIIAHDLRQPISAIALRSSLLLRAGLDEHQREDVRQIRTSAERLSRMATDLMDASLVETRRMQIAPERLDLGPFLHDVVQRVPAAAARTTVRTPSGSRLFVNGDPQRLEQVVENLLSNAVKYGEPDTPIGVELAHVDGLAEIRVTNRGVGVTPDELPGLFDRYVRSRAARASATKGLGLGLYIARGLVEAHGGRIWAESIPGDVTTFCVVLPLDGPPVPIDDAPRAEAKTSVELTMGRS